MSGPADMDAEIQIRRLRARPYKGPESIHRSGQGA
jgi:hypothetical protein